MSAPGNAIKFAPKDPAASRTMFELRCADVHPCRCAAMFYGTDPGELVALAREHGALVHSFTPAFYTSQRLAAMTGAATKARR